MDGEGGLNKNWPTFVCMTIDIVSPQVIAKLQNLLRNEFL